jgi:fluoride exporter
MRTPDRVNDGQGGGLAPRRAPDIFRTGPAHRVHRQWRVLTVIAVGGGFGSVSRYLAGRAVPTSAGGFPWATFFINVSGCLALGALMVFVLEVWPPRRYVRPFWGIGFLGGFTTFSTYTAELRELLDREAWVVAGGYAVGSLVAGLSAVWLGVVGARFLASRTVRRGRRDEP